MPGYTTRDLEPEVCGQSHRFRVMDRVVQGHVRSTGAVSLVELGRGDRAPVVTTLGERGFCKGFPLPEFLPDAVHISTLRFARTATFA